MSIDEIRDLLEGIEQYIPEEYTPTDFEVVVSVDMDGVLAEFMIHPEKYMPTLRELRGDVLNVPKLSEGESVQTLLDWAQTLVDEVKTYQGDVNNFVAEAKANFSDVLKNFNTPPWMESEYYRWLPPMDNMVEAVRLLSKVPQIMDANGVVYNLKMKICSCSPNPDASLDKYIWLSQHLPEVDSITIVPYDEHKSGRNKAIALGLPVEEPGLPLPTPELIEHRQKSVFIHLDDNTKVINGMELYGVSCIKCLNGINDTHKSFVGPRVDILDSSTNIFKNMIQQFSKIATRVMDERFAIQNKQPDKTVELTSNEPDIEPLPDVDKDARNNNNER